jgi:hypothetical protein
MMIDEKYLRELMSIPRGRIAEGLGVLLALRSSPGRDGTQPTSKLTVSGICWPAGDLSSSIHKGRTAPPAWPKKPQ